jgi:hypothetical protein
MNILTRAQNMNLLRSVHKRLTEDAEAERERGSQNLYDRLQEIEFQKVLDEVDRVIHNGSSTPKARVEAVADIVNALYGDLEDDDEATDVDLTPSTRSLNSPLI